jgi:putative ABC transport system permease protein
MARWTRFRRMFGLEPKNDVEAELAFHVEMRIRELIDEGETPERARRLALRRFGDFDRARQECVAIDERRRQRMDRTEFWTELKQDLAYALRMMRRTPAFTAAALVTLALGIGANSAIFSVVNGVLLKSLPFRDAERLHLLHMLYPDGTQYASLSAPDFMSVRAWQQVFDQVEAIDTRALTMLGAGEPREIDGAFVSDGVFEMLGFTVASGRSFRAEENRPGQGHVTILSHGFWQRAFGGDPAALGRTVTTAGIAYTIIGIASPRASLPEAADAYFPMEFTDIFESTTQKQRRSEFLSVVARAKTGVTPAAIDADLKRIGTRLQGAFPDSNGTLTFSSKPLRDVMVGDVERPLLILLGAVGLVLLVACANVANLLLARGSARHGELSVRAAIGAGRARLVRQLITESILLGLIGGAIGLGLAYWSTQALVAARPADLPRLDDIRLDANVVWFTLGAVLVTSFVFGLVPALQATNDHLLQGLQESGRSGGGGRKTQRLRAGLVIAEMALAVVLLTGSGLLIRSFLALTEVDPGFQPGGAMSVRVTLQGADYQNGDQVRVRVDQLVERLRSLPGVTAIGVGSILPLGGLGALNDFAVDGAPPPPPNVNQEIAVASATPDYFKAIGSPLKRGRLFTDLDQPKSAPVALLNETAVRRWFPGQDPIGKRVLSGNVSREVVGIVGDVLQRTPGQPAAPQMFLPYTQRTGRSVRVIVRAQGDPLALAPAVREQVRALDPNIPLAEAAPLEEMVSRSVARPRFYTSLLTLFAAVALALSATGIFGVMSYAVAQQSKEIGIRMALGARAADVLRSVVGRALALAGLGVIAGLVVSLAFGGAIRNQLFGVTIFDPATLGVVVIVLLASATVASLLPAMRAARTDPATVFREV